MTGTSELTMLQAINEALHGEMARDERVMILGEDVGHVGGVFRATEGLFEKFGEALRHSETGECVGQSISCRPRLPGRVHWYDTRHARPDGRAVRPRLTNRRGAGWTRRIHLREELSVPRISSPGSVSNAGLPRCCVYLA